jgi:uncharacterized protein YhaN
MRIIEIHIYGYGKLENYFIPSMNQFQIIYGENEAGKSTIMSFIHSILFGFPARQSTDLRYEPKNHSKYGGKIKASIPGIGVAVIERVKGKAAGDVTVSLEDGTIGGEELLKNLMQRMDKNIYQAIFSFNVHGLQNIQAMKGEELGKYLFSAGTLGTDKLFITETALLKEMELRFKPSGKKPLMNEKLKELKEIQSALKNAEQQNEHYSELIIEKEEVERKIAKLEQGIIDLEKKGAKLKEYKRYEQTVIEEATLQNKLEENGSAYFPEDGLLRLEKINQQMKPVQARMLWIKDKRMALIDEAEQTKPDDDLLELETEIESRLESMPLLDQLKQDKRLLELKIEELTEEISQINDDLHTDFNEDSIQSINTSVFIKEEAETIQRHEQRLLDKKLELEAGFEEEKSALVQLETDASDVKNGMLPEAKRVELTHELEVLENKQQIQLELNQVKDQILTHKDRLKKEESRRKSQKKRDVYQLLVFGGIFLIVLLWGLINSQWLLTGVGAAGILLLLTIHFKTAPNSDKPGRDEILAELLIREQSLTERLNNHSDGNLFSIKNLLFKDEELRQRYRELLVKIEHQQIRYEKIIEQFEKWEMDVAEIKEKKAALIEQLGLSAYPGHALVFDAYQLLEKQKQYFREKKRTEEKLKAVSVTLEDIDKGLTKLRERFLQGTNLAPVETAAFLKKQLREAIDQKARFHVITRKLDELDEEYAALEKDQQVLAEEQADLLSQAKVENEEEFRIQAKSHDQVKRWSVRLADLNHQLAVSGITSLDRKHILNGQALEDQIDGNTLLTEKFKKELNLQYDRLANIKHNMNVLEEGGLYSELLHKYKQMKHDFEEDAKEWAKYAIAQDLLSKTIDRYKDERMPRMLEKAENFLSVLTDGSYVRIIPQLSGNGFLIERNDHVLFEANELSQATAEQVYVSIRLALAAVHYDRYPFPIIIDDSFVNFDHNRTERIIGLLKDVAEHNQILFFTCHRHLLEYFNKVEILNLEEKSKNIV